MTGNVIIAVNRIKKLKGTDILMDRAGLKFTVKITDTDMFRDIIELLKTLNDENPQLNIAEKMKQISIKHHYESEYLTSKQNEELAGICKDCLQKH